MPIRAALCVGAFAGGLLLCLGSTATAHVRSTEGTSQIRQDGSSVRYDLVLEYDLLAAATGIGKPQPGGHERLLVERRDRIWSYLDQRITVSLDGARCSSELVGTGVEEHRGVAHARIDLRYDCPGSTSGTFTVRYGVFTPADAVVDDHTNIADYELGGARGTYLFDSGHHEFEAGRTGAVSLGARFATMGLEHIVSGVDHLLFLALLLLGARGWRSVVRLATSFTVAHSITLGLAVLGWVRVPTEIVEPLIALSIVFVAVENIVGGESRHRTLVVFGFGLLHGLGFAGALSLTGEFSGHLLGALLSFNLGIEAGQLLLIGLLFPLLLLVRRFVWSSHAHAGATALAGVFGLAWFAERLLA